MTSYEQRLATCEREFMDGFYNEQDGDVDAPTGHFYRVGSYIVVTDAQGFKALWEFANANLAANAFMDQSERYSRWLEGES